LLCSFFSDFLPIFRGMKVTTARLDAGQFV
jgi:hypothetical protein